ncbi:ferredoxin reductase family protein [Mycolicibacterium sarraceniae]|uniref:Ferric reductase n=1 Tax=Mycolicibacterium sarraceniae TaxID=1534348 RepID=A0A7I7SX47_9MYCO|nr:ferric reductase-like transmembrane domain-containing protein [Mycolicibacterium sarraceniae]BBY61612.1 ferric reductase [Mycolicibacterium sarraceniae]
MIRVAVRGSLWFGLYVAVAMFPLAFAAIGVADQRRGFWREFAAALGFVGLSMMGMQLILVARIKMVAAPFGEDALVAFHRYMGYAGTALVFAHPLLLIVLVDPSYIERIIPWTAPWAGRFGSLAILCLLGIIVTSVWRVRLRISYETWHAIHLVASAVAIIAAVVHVELINYYIDRPWKRGLWIVMSAALLGVFVWVRIIRPAIRMRHPWTVDSVVAERGGISTITFKPVNHAGFTFAPGQFGWLSMNRSPFSLTQHPFSFSSNGDDPSALQMAIKSLGDFTTTLAGIQPGTRAYIDGPHGVFSPDRNEGPGFAFIAGGVGISPIMSMLRTLAARGDRRPCHLFYGVNSLAAAAFSEEIDELASELELSVWYVVADPEPDWSGDRGFISEETLRMRLPARYQTLQYFICGPGALQDAMADALGAMAVPADRVHTEHFNFV